MELVVSLGLVGILMVILVTGNVFIQKVIGQWSMGNRLYEEGEWIIGALAEMTRTCDSLYYLPRPDRIVFFYGPDSVHCTIENETLRIRDRVAHHQEVKVKNLKIEKWAFTNQEINHIFDNDDPYASGLYQIEVELSYRGKTDVIQIVTRNSKATFQNRR